MRCVFLVRIAAGAFLVLSLALTGCVTSKKYRLAKDDVPPAVTLGWSVATPSAELTLQSLIVFKGPGSWKREARWDEYVVGIANRGPQPVVIDGAELIDVLGKPQVPGADPWALEKLSYTNWDKYGKTGLKVVAGVGAVAIYGAAVAATATASLMGGGAAAGGVFLLNAIPVVAIVDISAVAVMNHQNKEKVMAEFAKRRLVLPLTVAPGETARGSLFFPMTPGPQRLIVKGRAGDAPFELVLELKELAGLHLKPGTEIKATPPPKGT